MPRRTRSSGTSSLRPSAGTWWKLLGAAGVAGLVATGALTVRQERRRAAYTPDEIRERLHRRHAEAEAELARREVVLDATANPPRTLRQRLDLAARRHGHEFGRDRGHRPGHGEAPDPRRDGGARRDAGARRWLRTSTRLARLLPASARPVATSPDLQ